MKPNLFQVDVKADFVANRIVVLIHDKTSFFLRVIILQAFAVVWRYNGTLPQGDKGRRRSKFALCKRSIANGVQPVKHHVVQDPQNSEVSKCQKVLVVSLCVPFRNIYTIWSVLKRARDKRGFVFSTLQLITDQNQHSVSYTLSRQQAIIVQYDHDDDTDMYQIGRSSEHQIDFVVMDTVPGAKRAEDCVVTQSTISRFACRILVDRNPPHTARLYAAGFDNGRNIFLGVSVIIAQTFVHYQPRADQCWFPSVSERVMGTSVTYQREGGGWGRSMIHQNIFWWNLIWCWFQKKNICSMPLPLPTPMGGSAGFGLVTNALAFEHLCKNAWNEQGEFILWSRNHAKTGSHDPTKMDTRPAPSVCQFVCNEWCGAGVPLESPVVFEADCLWWLYWVWWSSLFPYEHCLCRSQEKATKWYSHSQQIDGLTTNGILVMHPTGGFNSDQKPTVWREVSVGGGIYEHRESRSTPQKSSLVSLRCFSKSPQWSGRLCSIACVHA